MDKGGDYVSVRRVQVRVHSVEYHKSHCRSAICHRLPMSLSVSRVHEENLELSSFWGGLIKACCACGSAFVRLLQHRRHIIISSLQALLCEFLGTFMFVLTISLSQPADTTPKPPNMVYIAAGCTLCALIFSFNHLSGAHFNPAVTLGAFLNRRISLLDAVLYILVQVLGGTCGALLALAIASRDNIKPFVPATGAPIGQIGSAMVVEFLYTYALCLVMQNAAMEKNAREPNSYFGLAISFTVLAGVKAVGPLSGGCFNPAVGTGLDIASLANNGSLTDMWVYWLAPCLGAVAASGTKIYMNLPYHAESTGLPLVVPLTEFIGTFFLVLTAALTGDGLAVGSMLMAMVYMGDHVCGADFNPAVSLGVALRMGVPLREYWKVILTVMSQFAGAMAAAVVAYEVSGDIQLPAQSGVHGLVGAVVFEAIWTSLLVYVVCAVMTPTQGEEEAAMDERRGHSRSFQGLAIGFVVVGGIYCGTKTGGGSGGVFNPALGSAIFAMKAALQGYDASGIWVYFAGPFAGSVIGAGIFSLLHYNVDGRGAGDGTGYDELEPSYY